MLRVVLFLLGVAIVEGHILVMKFELAVHWAAVVVFGAILPLLIVLVLLAAWSHGD